MKRHLVTYMHFALSVILTFVAILLFILITSVRVKADCVHVWKQGTVAYVQAGQPIHFIVEEEDSASFQHQKTVPVTIGNFPPKNMAKEMATLPTVNYCGEYNDVSDEDFD